MPGWHLPIASAGIEGSVRANSSCIVRTAIGTAALFMTAAVRGDPISVVNAIRMEGCGDRPGVRTAVVQHTELDRVARELPRRTLPQAIARTDFPAAASASFHVRGSRDDDAVKRILTERHCAAINDPRFNELGAFQSGDESWIVLAVRVVPPPVLELAAVERRVLELVNSARSEARRCGRDRHEPTTPLTLSPALTTAALLHARDMAERGTLEHRGADGTTSGDRITRAGYTWQASGENIAAGQQDADTVVAGWLASPGHCATLMGPQFSEMGVGFALAPGKNPAIYWAQLFAAPRIDNARAP